MALLDELLKALNPEARGVFNTILAFLNKNEELNEDEALKVALEAVAEHDIWMNSQSAAPIISTLVDEDLEANRFDGYCAAGWIKELFNLGNRGIWGLMKFTGNSSWQIRDGEMKYLSSTIHKNWKNDRTGKAQGKRLLAAALTCTPFDEEMPPIQMIGDTGFAFGQIVSVGKRFDNFGHGRTGYTLKDANDIFNNFVNPGGSIPPKRELPIDHEHEMFLNSQKGEHMKTLEEFQAKLRKLFGVGEEADLIETMTAHKVKAGESVVELNAIKTKLQESETSLSEAATKIEDLKKDQTSDNKVLTDLLEQNRTLGLSIDDLQKFKKETEDKDADSDKRKASEVFIDEAILKHKIRKGDRDQYVELHMLKPETVEKIVTDAKAIVDVETHGQSTNDEPVEISEKQTDVNKKLGVRESFAKAMESGRPESDFIEKKGDDKK